MQVSEPSVSEPKAEVEQLEAVAEPQTAGAVDTPSVDDLLGF